MRNVKLKYQHDPPIAHPFRICNCVLTCICFFFILVNIGTALYLHLLIQIMFYKEARLGEHMVAYMEMTFVVA